MSFAFHAAAPPGEWLNDPNGLAFVDGRYVLYAQHSVSGPSGADVGWGRLASDDLLAWRWDGVAIPPSAAGSAYSGSLAPTASGVAAFYTRHDPVRGIQTQHRAAAPGFGTESPPLGPRGRDCRDPFVFRSAATGDWRMLIAEPCNWSDWAGDTPSRLAIWRSADCESWHLAGTIGSWHPRGVMWEVPVLLTIEDVDVLILSLIDRRDGGAACSVRYWLGRFDETGFARAPDFPADGLPFDHGPDFYAAIANLPENWPGSERVILGWASNWAEARHRTWPGGSRGGPISLPRALTLRGGRLRQTPIAAALALPHQTGTLIDRLTHGPLTVVAERTKRQLHLARGDTCWTSPVDWQGATSTYRLFDDCGLVELFVEPEGVTVTVALA